MKVYPFQHRHPTTGTTTSSPGIDLKLHIALQFMKAYISRYPNVSSDENKNIIQASFELADDFLTYYEGVKK